jgi:hypothetical protein
MSDHKFFHDIDLQLIHVRINTATDDMMSTALGQGDHAQRLHEVVVASACDRMQGGGVE